MLAMVARSGRGQRVEPLAEELDELPDHAALAQHLGHGQDQIGGGGAGRQLAGQLEADHLGQQHRHRLAQHRGLRLDAAHAPADDAEPVDHRRVRVGADQRVGERADHAVLLLEEDDAGQVLEVDLVHDAGAGRHHAQAAERLLAPAQELVALAVALVLELDVAAERHRLTRRVDLHRVIDDEVGRSNRAHHLRRAAQRRERLAHGGQVDDRRDAGEVLQDDAGRAKRDLARRRGRRIPVRHRLDVLRGSRSCRPRGARGSPAGCAARRARCRCPPRSPCAPRPGGGSRPYGRRREKSWPCFGSCHRSSARTIPEPGRLGPAAHAAV